MSIYESLGVKPIINAAGTFTSLGGSLMPAEVIAAWQQAAGEFVDMVELQTAAGQHVAELLRVPSAMVTGGAAHSIVLGVAAAISAREERFVTANQGCEEVYEVLRPTSHRDVYDRQVATCGVRIIDVDDPIDVARRKNDRTVLMMAYNFYEPSGSDFHQRWLDAAQSAQLPTLLDAAADVPPIANFQKYLELGYDMVTFSGGKAICGPQDTGLLVGSTAFIELARQNASPWEGTIGRVAKVAKEDIVALCKAIEWFLEHGSEIAERCQRQLNRIDDRLQSNPSIHLHWILPEPANHFPHLALTWDEVQSGFTSQQLDSALRNGTPAIATGRVYGTGNEGLVLSAINLKPGEEDVVSERILDEFRLRNL